MKQITFSRSTEFLGRNGTARCSGLELHHTGNEVQLLPLKSRGQVGRCLIVIPAENVDELIRALQEVQRAK